MLVIPDLKAARRILCVQPHPDDTDIGAGGTVAKLSRGGAEIFYLTVTNDSAGVREAGLTGEEIREIRKREQESAARILGIKELIWLDYPDAGDYSIYSVRNDIIKQVRLLKPDFLVTVDPWLPYEAHRDHIKTGLAASEALILCSLPHIVPDVPPGGVTINGIAFYHTAAPNTVINVEETWELKFEAISQHKSQFSPDELAMMRSYFEMKASEYAGDKGFRLGEAFKLLHPLQLHCFVDAWKA